MPTRVMSEVLAREKTGAALAAQSQQDVLPAPAAQLQVLLLQVLLQQHQSPHFRFPLLAWRYNPPV